MAWLTPRKLTQLAQLEVLAWVMLLSATLYMIFFMLPQSPFLALQLPENLAAIGCVLSVVALLMLRLMPKRRLGLERLLYALFLAGMPLIYVAAAGLKSGNLLVELAGTALFMGWAVWGYRGQFAWLALGILAHGLAWDSWHHASAYIEVWYPPACLLVDAMLALVALTQAEKHQ